MVDESPESRLEQSHLAHQSHDAPSAEAVAEGSAGVTTRDETLDEQLPDMASNEAAEAESGSTAAATIVDEPSETQKLAEEVEGAASEEKPLLRSASGRLESFMASVETAAKDIVGKVHLEPIRLTVTWPKN